MAIGVGSLLEARVFQRLQGQQVLNVSHWEVLAEGDGVATLAGFAEAFMDFWYGMFSPHQSNQLTYERVELYELNGIELDVYAYPTPQAGLQAGEILGTFSAVSVQLIRGSRATRHGWKRFAGVTEPMVNNGVLTPTVYSDFSDAAEEAFNSVVVLTDPLQPARTISVRCIIWGGNSLDYPLGRYSDVIGTQTKNLVTTQNTRKIGRGS